MRNARFLLALALACAAARAADEDSLESRVARLEKLLEQERSRGDRAERRIAELEEAFDQATETLARSHDRRQLEREIDDYLEQRGTESASSSPSSRLNIGAVLVASFRAARLTGNIPDTNTFQVEDRYLRFVYRFSDEVTARYYTDGSLAELEYHRSDLLQLNAGVIVVPFGQFNARSFPDTFETLSRPLLYLGDEDTFTTPPNHPRPVFRSLYSDTGVVLSGSLWRGESQLYYAAYLTNGLVGVGDLGQGSTSSDNNDNKQVGARVAYTTAGWFERTRIGFGASAATGKYDSADLLSYRLYGFDFLLVIDGLLGGEGSVTVRAEYVYAPRETLAATAGDTSVFVNDASRVQGAYLIVEARLDRRWMVYVEADWLARRAPLLNGGLFDPTAPDDATTRILRYSFGVVRKFEIGIIWKAEYAFWDFDLASPDAHRFSTQVVIPF